MELDQFKYTYEMKLDDGKKRELPSFVGTVLSFGIYILLLIFVG